jgi:hypothetical protein
VTVVVLTAFDGSNPKRAATNSRPLTLSLISSLELSLPTRHSLVVLLPRRLSTLFPVSPCPKAPPIALCVLGSEQCTPRVGTGELPIQLQLCAATLSFHPNVVATPPHHR